MTIEQLQELVEGNLPDNRIGAITPFKHREVWQALLDYIQQGGQNQIAEGVITSAQILDSNTNPVELIPAPGAGKIIWIESIGHFNSGGTAYATNTSSYIRHSGQDGVNGYPILLGQLISPGDVAMNFRLTANDASETIVNKSLIFDTNTGDPTTGTFDIFYSIKYRIIDNPF